MVLLFFLLAMILVSSLLFGRRNVASLWGLERSAMAPETVNSEQVTQALSKRYGLTTRETEVMGLLMKGRNEPFISEALFISPVPPTVTSATSTPKSAFTPAKNFLALSTRSLKTTSVNRNDPSSHRYAQPQWRRSRYGCCRRSKREDRSGY